jgi:tetratricopeptide (TPR) repeat protein
MLNCKRLSTVPGAALLLAAAWSVGLASNATAQQRCELEEAQRLFGQQPRPVATIERMLAACRDAGSNDYRIFMFQGVMARDSGNREQAIEFLQKARQADPQAINPALELGFTFEAEHGPEARQVYEDILKREPTNRPALLGLARVARGQNRLDEAHAIYQNLLAVNPKDTEALNGMAWLALADRRREPARVGFEQVLVLDPKNEEAKIGLSKVENVYRYVFDADGAIVSTANGSSWGFGGRGLIGVSAFDTLEVGWTHFTNELQTLSAIGLSVLPSDDLRAGYNRLVPLSYSVSLTYDYRGHTSLPTEHWIEGGVAVYITDYLRWFGGYRQAFGGFQYDGRLIRTGLSASLSDSWEVSATFFDAAQAVFNNYQEILSWVFDVTYHGPRNTLVVAGVGYSPLIDNVDLHARTILPITDRMALQLAIAHNSINADTRATFGLRFNW